MKSVNEFSLGYYASILDRARREGYNVGTLMGFLAAGSPASHFLILRHDVDHKPSTLVQLLDIERKAEVRSTNFVRVMGSEYNPFAYPIFRTLRDAQQDGFEIGLHSNFVEFATINGIEVRAVLAAEVATLRSFFRVDGVSTHRDVNYAYNALPTLEQNWPTWKTELSLKYHAYERRILDATVYVNEGLNPHLGWRSHRPEDILSTGKSIYLLTHNHWWYRDHPFEA